MAWTTPDTRVELPPTRLDRLRGWLGLTPPKRYVWRVRVPDGGQIVTAADFNRNILDTEQVLRGTPMSVTPIGIMGNTDDAPQ